MNKKVFLKNNRLYLRKFEKSDISDNYLSWLKDPELTKFMCAGGPLSTKKDLFEYYRHFKANKNDFLFAIILNQENKHIGNLRLGPVEWNHKRTEFGILIGDKKNWGKGFAVEAIKTASRHAFEDLCLNRINIFVVEENKSAVAAYKRAGFKIEGCLRENYWLKGKSFNTLLMGLLKKEFIDYGSS